METDKVYQIFYWMASEGRYESGVTNQEVISHFGESYKKEWEKLKSSKEIFHEKGKWFRWSK